MSMYKKGDKFIIEIGEVIPGHGTLYRIKGFNTLVFDEHGLNKLERYTETPSGEWELGKLGDPEGRQADLWYCDKCKMLSVFASDYCPNCGAKINK